MRTVVGRPAGRPAPRRSTAGLDAPGGGTGTSTLSVDGEVARPSGRSADALRHRAVRGHRRRHRPPLAGELGPSTSASGPFPYTGTLHAVTYMPGERRPRLAGQPHGPHPRHGRGVSSDRDVTERPVGGRCRQSPSPESLEAHLSCSDCASRSISPPPPRPFPAATPRCPSPPTHFVNGHALTPPYPEGFETAVFGMGCFWGAERRSGRSPASGSTAVGYAGGITPNPTYEEVCSGRTGHTEAVLVVFDPEVVTVRPAAEGVLGGPRPDPGHAPGQRPSAPSTAPPSTADDAQRRRRRGLERRASQPALSGGRLRRRSPPRSPRPARSTSPRATTSSTWPRTPTATAASAAPACPARSASDVTDRPAQGPRRLVAEGHADAGAGPAHLRHAVLPGALARAAHHQQVAVARRSERGRGGPPPPSGRRRNGRGSPSDTMAMVAPARSRAIRSPCQATLSLPSR